MCGRIPFYFILFLSVFTLNCSPKLAPQGLFKSTPVVADGNADDWTLPLRFSNEK